MKTNFWKEKQVLDTNANINTSSTYSHKLHGQMIFNNQQAHILKKKFMFHTILLELGYLATKQLTSALLHGFELILIDCLFTSHFNGLSTSSLNIFAIIEWSSFTCFYNVVIPFVVFYKMRPFFILSFRVTKQNKTIVTKNTSHGLKACLNINIFVINHTHENPT